MLIDLFTVAPTAASAAMLPPIWTVVVVFDGSTWPSGMESAAMPTFGSTLPVASAIHPITFPPSVVARFPLASKLKAPARV